MKNLICGLLFIISAVAFATLNDVEKAGIWPKNILSNPGFENGKAGWSVSSGASLTIASGDSNTLTGRGSLIWDATAANITLTSAAATIPKGLYGKNGVAVCKIQVPSGTATHTFRVYDGSAQISGAVTVTSSTTPVYNYANFPFPSSGSVYLQMVSNADEPSIAIDDCGIFDASEINLTNIAQASFIGSAYYATTTNCQWQRTNTAVGAFGTDTDCPGPTIESNPGPGTIDTTDNNLPQLPINNLPPGRYRVTASFGGGLTGGSANGVWYLTDGTSTIGGVGTNLAAGEIGPVNVGAEFTYTTTGSRTFAVYAASSAQTMNIYSNTGSMQLRFTVYRYPTSAETAYKPDMVPFSWSGIHDNTCAWANNTSTMSIAGGDATCALSQLVNNNFGSVTSTADGTGATPGISFVPTMAGTYYACANAIAHHSGALANQYLSLTTNSGTTIARGMSRVANTTGDTPIPLCGPFQVSSISSSPMQLYVKGAVGTGTLTIGMSATASNGYSINWSVFNISNNLPTPLLVNSVVTPASDVRRICSGKVVYSAGVPSASRSAGNCVSSVTDTNTGRSTLNFVASTFSSAPDCFVTPIAATATGADSCRIEADSTSTTLQVLCYDGANADIDYHFLCMGPK